MPIQLHSFVLALSLVADEAEHDFIGEGGTVDTAPKLTQMRHELDLCFAKSDAAFKLAMHGQSKALGRSSSISRSLASMLSDQADALSRRACRALFVFGREDETIRYLTAAIALYEQSVSSGSHDDTCTGFLALKRALQQQGYLLFGDGVNAKS